MIIVRRVMALCLLTPAEEVVVDVRVTIRRIITPVSELGLELFDVVIGVFKVPKICTNVANFVSPMRLVMNFFVCIDLQILLWTLLVYILRVKKYSTVEKFWPISM